MEVLDEVRTPDRYRIFQDWPLKRFVEHRKKKKTFALAVPTERLTEPRIIFALFTVTVMWLLHERHLVIVISDSYFI